MKKAACYAIVTLLVLVNIFIFPAAAETDNYTAAAEGDLLYTANFNGDEYWKPAKTATATGDLNVEVDAVDPGKARMTSMQDKVRSRWGGEIAGLPLNENTAYTIYYTITRDTNDGSLGVFADDQYGFYGYSYNNRIVVGGSTMTGHATIKYVDYSIDAEGDTAKGAALSATTLPSVQHYAFEVNGQNSTIKLYVTTTKGEWTLVDQTNEGEILTFYTYNLGLYFYEYYVNQPVTVSDVRVHKGMLVSGDKLVPVEKVETTKAPVVTTTAAPVTTAKPAVTTASPAKTTAPSGTTAAPVVTTVAPISDEKKGGCGSSVAGYSAVMILAAAVFVFKKKK